MGDAIADDADDLAAVGWETIHSLEEAKGQQQVLHRRFRRRTRFQLPRVPMEKRSHKIGGQ